MNRPPPPLLSRVFSVAVSSIAVSSIVLGSSGCGRDPQPSVPTVASRPLDPTPGASVVLISIDTLRADHLSTYGYDRPTSPNLDALAARSVQFEHAYSHANSTAPSHMTMLTGVLPEVHDVWNGERNRVSASIPSLAELLADHGYETAAFTDGGFLTANFGFERGFQTFQSGLQRFDRKIADIDRWLRASQDDARPAFLFVHTYGVHAPYLPSTKHDLFTDRRYQGRLRHTLTMLREFVDERGDLDTADLLHEGQERMMAKWHEFSPEDLRYLQDLYDGCIHQVDDGIARLLRRIDATPRFASSWIIVVSDHGEAFGEHGTLSHRQVYEEELHVPLLIRPPEGLDAKIEVDAVVGLCDLAPTILLLLGVPIPSTMQGASLFPIDAIRPHSILSYSGEVNGVHALRKGEYKLINRPLEAAGLFDIRVDPKEVHDLAPSKEQADRVERLRRDIVAARQEQRRLREQLGPAESASPLDASQVQALRALGYVK